MKISFFAFSRQGCVTARKVMGEFPEAEIRAYTMERFEELGFEPISRPTNPFYGEAFHTSDALIFVGAVGIAVRKIAPFLKSKTTDPAVICLDELGQYVIPLLSGHIGGANQLALQIAAALGATPVVTTATDINHKFSVDAWATQNGCLIGSMHRAKLVAAEILERNVSLHSDFPICTELPGGVVKAENGPVGISISYRKVEPYDQTLRLIPRVLHLGIGCHRGETKEKIAQAVDEVLQEQQIDPRAIKCVASIDLKANEAGLLEFCRERDWPVEFYSAEVLRNAEGEFTSSAFVSKITGVDNVCERAASIGAEEQILPKTVRHGVTIALAAEKWEVRFG